MILRVWRASATRDGADAYRRHFEGVVRPELLALAGFAGAVLLEREHEAHVEIVVETRWYTREAISVFAGADPERAVVEPGARAVLAQFDEHVAHYEVVADVSGS